MKKKNKFLVILFLVLIPSGMLLSGCLNKPIDPPLTLEVPAAPEATATSEPSVEVEVPSEPPESEAAACGGSGKMKILLVGVASHLVVGHEGADLIRLVVVDFDEMTTEVLALPADLWVDTPDELIEELDFYAPLNLIYLSAYNAAHGNSEKVWARKGTQVLAQTIVDEFGFVPDKYINLNGDVFIDMVDTLGGVTVTLDEEVESNLFGVFPEGTQSLDGQRTLDFVRLLYPNGTGPDYAGRFERQNMVVYALLDAVLKPENWIFIPDLIKDARKFVVTDLSVDQVRDLVCIVEEAGSDAELIDVSIENGLMFLDGQRRLIPDLEAIREIITEMGGD